MDQHNMSFLLLVISVFSATPSHAATMPPRVETDSGNTVVYNYCDPNARLAPGVKKLGFLSYNINDGGTAKPDSQTLIKAYLKQTHFDVLALQEVDLRYKRSGINRDFAYEIAKQNHLCGLFVTGANWSDYHFTPLGLGRQGVVVLTRFPIVSYRAVKLPEPEHPWWGTGDNHGEQRSVAELTIKPDGKTPVHILGTHLSVPDSDRHQEIHALKWGFKDRIGTLSVLLGDLNAPSHSNDMNYISMPSRTHTFIEFKDAGDMLPVPATVNTYPSENPNTQIDHVMFHGKWQVVSQSSQKSDLSDHDPIYVEAEFRK